MTFLKEQKDGAVLLSVYIQPKASKTHLVGLHGGAVKLAITAPPVDGKANKAVISYIAHLLQIPSKAVAVKSGSRSRRKSLLIKNIPLADVTEIIDNALLQCKK